MALTWTHNTGNVRASASLAASASVSYDVDWSAFYEILLGITSTAGTVSGTNGLRVQVAPRSGSTPATATESWLDFSIPSVASSTARYVRSISPARYTITITNLDTVNALTAVVLETSTLDTLA
jgi:hypothetical protein